MAGVAQLVELWIVIP